MANIPRRKIYEVMLEYEEALLELQILTYSKNHFEKYKDDYKKALPTAIEKYKKIKALLVLFFQNITYEKDEELQSAVNYYLTNEEETNSYLKGQKLLSGKFKKIIKYLDEIACKQLCIDTLNNLKNIFAFLDDFNSQIPFILEIRRDKM